MLLAHTIEAPVHPLNPLKARGDVNSNILLENPSTYGGRSQIDTKRKDKPNIAQIEPKISQECFYMSLQENLNIEIHGIFAQQVRTIATMMGVTHETVIQMAIAGFAASPIASNLPVSVVSAQQMQVLDSIPHVNSDSINAEVHAHEILRKSGDAYSPYMDSWSMLHRDNIDFGSIEVSSQTVPEREYYLWGQFSRFLPIKFTLRMLAFLSENSRDVSLQKWADAVRAEGSNFREFLRELDVKLRRRRGTQMASGFPKDSEKSNNRFVNHFCADIFSNGKLVGMPAHLGLITCEGEIIRFTPKGLEYVKAENPILDDSGSEDNTIGSDERLILLDCIRDHLPSEWGFMLNILNWINEGHDTPDLLTGKVKEKYGPGTEQNWNQEQASTYRGGAIGRLGEIGVVERQWESRRVTYLVSSLRELID